MDCFPVRSIPTTTPNNDGDDDKTVLQHYYADEMPMSEQRQTREIYCTSSSTTDAAPNQ